MIEGLSARRLKDLGRRYGWAVSDQALSSLSNFSLSILVARSMSPRQFGIFGLIFSSYLFCLNVVRAIVGGPFLVQSRSRDDVPDRLKIAWVCGVATLVGVVGGLISAGAGLLVGNTTGTSLLLLALFLPGLMLQDAWRYVFFGLQEPRKAALNDLIWLLFMVASLVVIFALDNPSLPLFIVAWGLSATLAAAAGMWQASNRPRLRGSLSWLWNNRAIARDYLADMALLILFNQLVIYGLAILAGITEVGAFRGAQVLLNLMSVFSIGIALSAIPRLAQRARANRASIPSSCARIAALLSSATVAWGTLLWLLPDEIGIELLGRTWGAAQALIVPMTVAVALTMFMFAAQIGLRALVLPRRSIKARLIAAPFIAGGALLGALISGAEGATWGLGAGQAVASIAWWWQLRSGVADASDEADSLQVGTQGMDQV